MTWPFENDTSAIVKKLADRSIQADRRRNVFIIVTIAFAACLITVLEDDRQVLYMSVSAVVKWSLSLF